MLVVSGNLYSWLRRGVAKDTFGVQKAVEAVAMRIPMLKHPNRVYEMPKDEKRMWKSARGNRAT